MYNKDNPNYKLYLAGIITENQYYEAIDIADIMNQELPDNLKPLMISVGNLIDIAIKILFLTYCQNMMI